MADREFQIRITTVADSAGAGAARADLQGLTDKTTEWGHAGQQAGEKVNLSHREALFVMRQLSPEFAHLGHAAMIGFANPATLGLVAVAAAIGAIIRASEKSEG